MDAGRKAGRHKNDSRLPVDWQDDAACLDTDPMLFFNPNFTLPTTSHAKGDPEKDLPGRYKYCLPSADNDDTECPVRMKCLEYALIMREQYGIWGGLTTRERFKLLRQRYRLLVVDDAE